MNPTLRLRSLSRQFYTRPSLIVARDLLGRYLCRRNGDETLVGRIVEVEAYLGSKDPASHAYRGRTRRNEVMFGEGGFLYVYFTYGMHFCANVVTEGEGIANAVLLRALEPIQGVVSMEENRFGVTGSGMSAKHILKLCNGPGNLCKALAITVEENGTDLCGSTIWVARGRRSEDAIGVSTRVGLTKGTSSRWRFFLKGNSFVSPGRPSGPG